MSEAFVRPFRPVELTASTLTSFPLQAMAQQLMTEEAFQTSGRNALTLIHHTNLTVVLTVLKAGAGLDEHHAPAPVTLLLLFGEIFDGKRDMAGQLREQRDFLIVEKIQLA